MEALDKLRDLYEKANGEFSGETLYYEQVLEHTARTALPILLDLVEALEWERECDHLSMPIDALLLKPQHSMMEWIVTQVAATAAVEQAKKALEEAIV